MQRTILTQRTLEEFYSQVILPQFGVRQKQIAWQDHTTIGPDNETHVFLCDDEHMVLVFDDYPTTTVDDIRTEFPGATITQISLGEGNVSVAGNTPSTDDNAILRYTPAVPYTYVHGITGYYQLFNIGTPVEKVRLMRLKSHRRAHQVASEAYMSLVDMGFELIALAKKEGILSHVEHLSSLSQSLAASHGFGDLADWFFNLSVDLDCHESIYDEPIEAYLSRQKKVLQSHAATSRINPGVTSADKDLLQKYTFPIHTKMMQNPDKSPEYFIEMAHTLNTLIDDKDLTVFVAAEELSFALDRPQIMANKNLVEVVAKAYELQMPRTLRHNDPLESWQSFYEEVKKVHLS